ncbi:MAG: hypothetical protein ACHQF3_15870 [Alphaproteobacteria bacterium]
MSDRDHDAGYGILGHGLVRELVEPRQQLGGCRRCREKKGEDDEEGRREPRT